MQKEIKRTYDWNSISDIFRDVEEGISEVTGIDDPCNTEPPWEGKIKVTIEYII